MYNILSSAHSEWHEILTESLELVDKDYLSWLQAHKGEWLPGPDAIFAAFSLPLSKTSYILLGESPYPRAQSANGYAFWDNSVGEIWSDTGLSKEVNRATSLRNFIKMLLYARGDLSKDFSQPAIAGLDKEQYILTLPELFNRLIGKGFLLLNASLVYSEGKVNYHARMWRPFLVHLLNRLADIKPDAQLILFGRIARELPNVKCVSCLVAEHPYNVSFIKNEQVLDFFKPFDLLKNHERKNNC